MTRCAALLVLVAACKSAPPAPPLEERASPTAVRCPHTEVNFTVAGERLCASVPLLLGHGVGDDGRIDIGTDLLFDRGPSKTPRRYLDEYPDDRPFGVTVSPQFKTADGHQYTLFFGIGGLRRREWTAPLTRPVLRGSLAYANMGSPENAGAYIQLSRQKLDEHGVPTTSGTYFSKSGTVTFQAIDLTRGRYTGRVDLVFERTGTLAPEDGPDVVEVKGDFDLRGE